MNRRHNPFVLSNRTPPRRVDWDDPKDMTVCVMGAFGFAVSTIERQTGFTVSQITYRLRVAGIKVTAYRNLTAHSLGRQLGLGVRIELEGRYRNVVRDALPARPRKSPRPTQARPRVAPMKIA